MIVIKRWVFSSLRPDRIGRCADIVMERFGERTGRWWVRDFEIGGVKEDCREMKCF